MATGSTSIDTLQDIKKMMEKSSRFISLSGWSGIAAGIFGIAGAIIAQQILSRDNTQTTASPDSWATLERSLILLAIVVFVCAFVSAFLFTYFRSRRDEIAIWGTTARRLIWNTLFPMLVGGVVILQLIANRNYSLIVPAMLIFYGLGLVNGSKYTLGEIRYMGYLQVLLGLLSLWTPSAHLLLWGLGFGVLHIIYGIGMWWRYDRKWNER